jgi:hypothetical protein
VLNIFVTQIMLQGSRIVPLIGQLKYTRMPQHVGMDGKWHLGVLSESSHHSPESHGTHGRAALAHEYVAPWVPLSLQSTQGPKLNTSERMYRVYPVLDAGHVQAAMSKVNLVPSH